jgi:hypothetical protein
MQAKETKLQDIIEGTKQYVIPLFQRTYSWTVKEWEILWKDLIELCEVESPRSHFIGSIVNMPTVSVPEGVAKFLLIDGQQRLTTIFVLLTLLRNKAREMQNQEFAEEINNTLLVNPYKKDNDFFKLMPTQVDRDAYKNFINGKPNESENQLTRAYSFFEKKLRQVQFEHEKLKKIITSYFSVVSIVLDADDNPYLVFESLNAKGRPLTQADLIRNYFFMRIHIDKQDEVYNAYWQPMQTVLNDSLTEYIRHFLMRDGSIIKQNDVYYTLKEIVSPTNAIDYLKELQKYSVYYQRLIYPEFEPEEELQKYFRRLNRIEERAEILARQALKIWNYFGQEKAASSDLNEVTGTTPTELRILGQQFHVQTWRDVLEQTLNTVAYLEPDKFEIIAHNYPRYISKDKNKFRAVRKLQNGYYVEVNMSAQSIQRFCSQAMETIELTSEDWSVIVT